MSDALRELLATFVVEVDKAGELAKGNAAVDLLKARLGELQTEFAKVKAPAAQAGKALTDVFSKAAQTAARNLEAITAASLGGSGAGNAFAAAGAGRASRLQGALGLSGRAGNTGFGDAGAANGGAIGAQVGPTRATLQTHQRSLFVAASNAAAATAKADAAAATYAGTLRGRLAGAVQAVRAAMGGGGAGGSGAKGPGLIGTLATVRNGFLALGVGLVINRVKHLVDGIGDISEGAARLGVTTDEFQRMSTWAKQNATDVDTLGTAFRTLATSAVDPSKEAAAAFAQLGVATKDSSGQFKTSQELFFEVGQALSGVTNETERTQLAQKLLGRSAMALKPMFAQGTEAFKKQREEMLKLKVLSPEVIAAADELSDSWVVLGTELLATAGPVLEDTLFPALKSLTGFLSDGVDWLGKFIDKTDFTSVAIAGVATGIGALAFILPPLIAGLGGVSAVLGTIATEVLVATWPFVALAAAFLVIEDAISFFRGKKSLIGDIIDALCGKGASTKVIETIASIWGAFGNLVTGGIDTSGTGPTTPASLQPPPGYYGPPTADGSVAGNTQIIGDTNIAITMGPSASAKDVGNEVGAVVDARNRDALIAPYPGI